MSKHTSPSTNGQYHSQQPERQQAPAEPHVKRTLFDSVRDAIGLIGLGTVITMIYNQGTDIAVIKTKAETKEARDISQSIDIDTLNEWKQNWDWRLKRGVLNDRVTEEAIERHDMAIWPADHTKWTNYEKRRRELVLESQ